MENEEQTNNPGPVSPKTAEELLQIDVRRMCADVDTCFPAMLEGHETERMIKQAWIMDKIMLSMLEAAEKGYDTTARIAIALRAQSQFRQTVLAASILDGRNIRNQKHLEKEQRRISRQEDKDWEAYVQRSKAEWAARNPSELEY